MFLSGQFGFDDLAVFQSAMDEIKSLDKPKIVFDMSDVSAIDSGAIGMFLVANDYAIEKQRKIVIRGASGIVRKIIEAAGINRFVDIQ